MLDTFPVTFACSFKLATSLYNRNCYNTTLVTKRDNIRLGLENVLRLAIEFFTYSNEFCTTSDHLKIAHVQEHVLPLYDLTMLNLAVSSVQHQLTLR